MKKNLLSTILLSLAITSFGQIVITNDDIAPVGTTMYQANDTVPSDEIVPGPAGEDKTWDFTDVVAHLVDTFYFVSPESTPFAEEFPESNFALRMEGENVFVYLIRNADKLSQIGMVLFDSEIDTMALHVIPEELILDFPVAYGNNYNENYEIIGVFESPEPGADSVMMKTNVVKETNIDAWGSLTIPLGSFDVLRERIDKVRTDSIFALVFGNWMFISRSQDSSTNYTWITNDVNIGFDLFSIDVDRSTGEVSNVTFMNSLPVGWHENEVFENSVFPNPFSKLLNIEFEEDQAGEWVLINQSGQIIIKEKINGQKHVQVNLSELPAGMYLYSSMNDNGEVMSSTKLIKY